MMMALAAARDLPCVLVPGGATLPEKARTPDRCSRSAHAIRKAKSRSIRRRGRLPGLRVPRRRLQFSGNRWNVAGDREAPRHDHSARGAGHPAATRSGSTWRTDPPRLCLLSSGAGIHMKDILTQASVRNAMVVHAAFGGSTNLTCTCPPSSFPLAWRAPRRGRLDRSKSPDAAPGRCPA
jgi:hypothetical protein